MKKILITGATGLIGTACSELCISKSYEVFGIDNNINIINEVYFR